MLWQKMIQTCTKVLSLFLLKKVWGTHLYTQPSSRQPQVSLTGRCPGALALPPGWCDDLAGDAYQARGAAWDAWASWSRQKQWQNHSASADTQDWATPRALLSPSSHDMIVFSCAMNTTWAQLQWEPNISPGPTSAPPSYLPNEPIWASVSSYGRWGMTIRIKLTLQDA